MPKPTVRVDLALNSRSPAPDPRGCRRGRCRSSSLDDIKARNCQRAPLPVSRDRRQARRDRQRHAGAVAQAAALGLRRLIKLRRRIGVYDGVGARFQMQRLDHGPGQTGLRSRPAFQN